MQKIFFYRNNFIMFYKFEIENVCSNHQRICPWRLPNIPKRQRRRCDSRLRETEFPEKKEVNCGVKEDRD